MSLSRTNRHYAYVTYLLFHQSYSVLRPWLLKIVRSFYSSASHKPLKHKFHICLSTDGSESNKPQPLHIIGSDLIHKTQMHLNVAYGNCFKTAFESLVCILLLKVFLYILVDVVIVCFSIHFGWCCNSLSIHMKWMCFNIVGVQSIRTWNLPCQKRPNICTYKERYCIF